MAAIINALFGTYPDPEPETHATNQTVVQGSTENTTERLHTSAVADDVHIKSVISSESQASSSAKSKLDISNLLSQLSTTHSQVDQYSRSRTAAINDQVQKSIGDVLARTQRQQEELLVDANRRHLIIDNEYKLQLQKAVEALDTVKAKTLADLERELQAQQQAIMIEAKRDIDVLNDQANAAKLHALVEAQEQGSKGVAQIADQMAASGQLDTHNLLQSTTTTIITSQSQATGNTGVVLDNQMQVAVKSPSELVLTGTTDGTTVFGTTTGSSDLTTTPASTVAASLNADTSKNSSHDNTHF